MHRLVIGLTSLLGIAAVGVIAFYVLLGGLTTDRAAKLVPADSAFYATVYLQPSAGQQAQLASVLSRLPGFEDTAALDTKIDELAQRFLGEAGFDYRSEVKPWLGNQISIAGGPPDSRTGEPTSLVVIADVKDATAASAGLVGLLPEGTATGEETYEGLTLTTSDQVTYAIVDGMLVAGETTDAVHGAIDVAQGRADGLAGLPAFTGAMRTLPADHLASAWVDLSAMATAANPAGAVTDMAGLSTFAMAILAEEAGFRLVGQLPVDAESVGAAVRDALAAGAQVPQVPDAMPAGTELSFVLFDLRTALEQTEAQLDEQSPDVAATIDQLRGLAGFGLGIDIDNDLLPLLDGEVGVAVSGLAAGAPDGAVLLRPDDASAAAEALDRILTALESRGSSVERSEVAGTELVTVGVEQFGSVSWAVVDGMVVLGLTDTPVREVLEARAGGLTLGASEGYRSAFGGAERGGTELFVDLNALVPLIVQSAGEGMPAETQDILEHLESFAVTTPSRPDRFEFHATLAIR